ncbi:MAG: sensor domain-containing diguanylate cyclase [Hydrogenothermaceae bacterium]
MATNLYKNFRDKINEEEYKETVKIFSKSLKDIKGNIKKLISSEVEFQLLTEKQKKTILKFVDVYVDQILPQYPDEKLVRKIHIAGKKLLVNDIPDMIILNLYNKVKSLLKAPTQIIARIETDILAVLRPYTLLSLDTERKINKLEFRFHPSIKLTVVEKFQKAKAEHINTKNKVIRYIFDDTEDIKIKKASECQFVKILEEIETLKEIPAYKDILKIHSDFHEYINFVILNRNSINASHKYLLLKELENTSLKLMYLLNELQIDITQNASFIDNLTESYNKNAFNLIFPQEVKRAQRYGFPLSILMVDIDNFKKINDTYGHLVGDEVLNEFSRVIKKSIRKTDYLFRFGGEEFLILLPHTSIENAFKVGEKIRKKVEETIFSNEHLKITVSCGLSEVKNFDNPYLDIEEADKMLYVSKNSGKNRCTMAR